MKLLILIDNILWRLFWLWCLFHPTEVGQWLGELVKAINNV